MKFNSMLFQGIQRIMHIGMEDWHNKKNAHFETYSHFIVDNDNPSVVIFVT